MFLEYIDKTNIFVKIQISNLSKIIKHNILKYIKNKKREYINLKIYIKTINILPKKQSIDRFCKNIIRNKSNLDFVYIDSNFVYINLDLAYINLDFA